MRCSCLKEDELTDFMYLPARENRRLLARASQVFSVQKVEKILGFPNFIFPACWWLWFHFIISLSSSLVSLFSYSDISADLTSFFFFRLFPAGLSSVYLRQVNLYIVMTSIQPSSSNMDKTQGVPNQSSSKFSTKNPFVKR